MRIKSGNVGMMVPKLWLSRVRYTVVFSKIIMIMTN